MAGRLESLNVHGKTEFSVYPPVLGVRVRCNFPEAMFGQVTHAIRRHVTIQGTLHYHPGRAFPSRVDVVSLSINPADDDLPTLHDLRRLGKWDTGGLSAVEFVRALRDE